MHTILHKPEEEIHEALDNFKGTIERIVAKNADANF